MFTCVIYMLIHVSICVLTYLLINYNNNNTRSSLKKMISFNRFIKPVYQTVSAQLLNRNVSQTSTVYMKQIIEKKENNSLIIEAQIVKDPSPNILKPLESGACPVCSRGLQIKHTDVLILQQFVRPDGCMLPRKVTGLCKIQQKRMYYLVAMAQKAGLMSNLTPRWSNKDPTRRPKYKKYNTYWDETTIPHKYTLNPNA